MINDILKGVAEAVKNEFGDEYGIYTNTAEQGLNEPCFFISVLKPEIKQVLGNRYFLNSPVSVQFLSKNNNDFINDIGSRLFDCLELITVSGDLIRGTSMSYSISDGILIFNVSYGFYFFKNKQTEEVMENMKQKTEV